MSPRPGGADLLIVVSEYLPDPHLDLLRDHAQVIYDADLYADRVRLLESLDAAAAILIRNRTLVDEELLAHAPSLRVVGRLGVGLDNIDMVATARRGVEVFPAHGGNAVAVAEYVMGAMLVLVRGVFAMTESMKTGNWPRQGHAFGRELFGKTLGLLGFGAIAREVARRAAGFGMRVIASDPLLPAADPIWVGVESVTFDRVLAESDVLSIHVPLNEETRHLMDAAALSRMKPDALLINTSRGGTVNETAIADALRDGLLGGAALDVFAAEPLDPEAAAPFADLDNLILTPHLAGNTVESVDRVATITVDTVLRNLGLT